jgi:hypothetical protein
MARGLARQGECRRDGGYYTSRLTSMVAVLGCAPTLDIHAPQLDRSARQPLE